MLQNRPICHQIDRKTTQAIGRGLEQIKGLHHHGKHVFQWKIICILQKTRRKSNNANLQRIQILEIRFLNFFFKIFGIYQSFLTQYYLIPYKKNLLQRYFLPIRKIHILVYFVTRDQSKNVYFMMGFFKIYAIYFRRTLQKNC